LDDNLTCGGQNLSAFAAIGNRPTIDKDRHMSHGALLVEHVTAQARASKPAKGFADDRRFQAHRRASNVPLKIRRKRDAGHAEANGLLRPGKESLNSRCSPTTATEDRFYKIHARNS
jgi:hypothetical protein